MAEANSADSTSLTASRAALLRSLSAAITDARVLAAIDAVPRERFVPPQHAAFAYEDRPFPIGQGQTTSQPLMIALMLQELHLSGSEKVLEVGAGSGYQTALLSLLAAEVHSVELLSELAAQASQLLKDLDYANVHVHLAGEVLGWPAAAPYDAIIVAAASPRVPQSLVDQLAPGGRLVIPVGGREEQELIVAEKRPEGVVVTRKGACRFVPLIGPEAY